MNYLLNASHDAWFNMAFDEFCLERYPCDEPFFYLWRNSPSVIIGFNQNAYSEVNLQYLDANGIRLARRVTGGGAVYHDLQNINYTIIGRNISPEPFADALRRIGVDAVLSGRNDILVGGRKVSGYARRLGSRREIIHGTLMYDVDIDTLSRVLDTPESKLHAKGVTSVRSRVMNLREELPGIRSVVELQALLQEILSDARGRCMEFDDAMLREVQRLSDTKFSTWDWIFGRSGAAGFRRRAKFACGTVELGLDLDHGRISHISFNGDFIGKLPSETVCDRLRGVRYDEQSVLSALEGTDPSMVFSGMTARELAGFILGNL